MDLPRQRQNQLAAQYGELRELRQFQQRGQPLYESSRELSGDVLLRLEVVKELAHPQNRHHDQKEQSHARHF